MERVVVLVVFVILVLAVIPVALASIEGVTIGTTTYACEDKSTVDSTTSDGICPSDYASCDACYVSGTYYDDPDCCSAVVCTSFWCTDTNEVCGDSTTEETLNERDSEGDNVDGGGEGDGTVENCAGACSSGTENVIDDSNEPACLDTSEDDPESCADDAVVYSPITATGDVCQTGVSCTDTDDDGDYEVCYENNWHDADEAEEYCDAVGGSWTTGTGTSSDDDDFNTDLSDGYCDGDDGFVIQGAIVAEVTRGSEHCEAAAEEEIDTEVTVSVVDITDTSTTVDSLTTTYESSWSSETIGCHEDSSDNDVGSYSFSLEAGTYYIIVEAEGYNTVTKTVTVSTDETFESFWIYLSEGCQSDCTMNNGVCYAECDGVNSCAYQTYDETGESVAVYCDGLSEGYRYVLSEEEDTDANTISGYEVYCCTGTPQTYEREHFTAEDAETSCVDNIISKDKGYWLNGEFVTFHFVLFSNPDPTKDDCEDYDDFMCDMYGGAWCS